MENSSSMNISFSSMPLFHESSYHDFVILEFLASSFRQAIFLYLLLVAVLFLVKLKAKTNKKTKQPPLPPGPTPWPIIGNLPEIVKNKSAFRWIHGLMKQLNADIACIRLANTHVISVTSPEIAREFLKKYDSTFASRPVTMATEYSSRGFLTIAVVPWGEQWKKMRRVVALNIINPERLRWLLDKRTEEADNLIRFIYNQCNEVGIINLRVAVRQYSGNVIRKMMFNRRYFGDGCKIDGGPGIEEEEHVESLFTVLMHIYSFILSDFVPWLRALDLEGHEKIVSESMRIINSYHDPIIDERVQQWREARRRSLKICLMPSLAKDANGKPPLSVEEIKAQCTVHILYMHEPMLATVDNPSNAAEWAIAEMISQPETLEKAIKELDTVVGKNRLVQEADIPRLDYIKACAKEALRIHPVAPFNLPHVSNVDTTVAGYFIPKGSHVLLSRVGLGRNQKVWDKPLEFKPERHLKDACSGEVVELTEPELKFISFSAGRRGCIRGTRFCHDCNAFGEANSRIYLEPTEKRGKDRPL
ncbi:hypothetical protein CRYUN_Cryun05aG0125500 [Craigia yunnanensis]